MSLEGVKAKIVGGGPGTDMGQLRRNGSRLGRWHNQENIVRVLDQDVARGRRMQVRGICNEGRRAHCGALDDTC